MAKCTLDYLLNRSLKELEGVHPTVAEKALQVVNQAYEKGINIAVTSGFRSFEEQAKIYGQSRKSYIYKGKQYGAPKEDHVTNAEPGESIHNYGLAVDFTVFDNDSKPIWEGPQYTQISVLGKSLGFSWGGDWKGKLKDKPHYEFTFGLTLKQLQAGKRPPSSSTQKPVSSPSKPVTSAPVADKPIVPYPNKVLEIGSKGKDVERVQRAAGMPESLIDGVYGKRTAEYVKAYQLKKKLKVDGVVGSTTWNKMF
ncbi:D-alanyl-D-alanine carboxypeptidase family protein [Priestia aryabhattai]|uniref:D-alanyl-D-alanine carboxypeptidase family protein n=1 Tax=Priestia aryabhattai TaxID=412384 RepID=UPI0039A1DE95